jgi:hypothetical protein
MLVRNADEAHLWLSSWGSQMRFSVLKSAIEGARKVLSITVSNRHRYGEQAVKNAEEVLDVLERAMIDLLSRR